ncbi:MAG: aminoacyl-tRNA hydrolase [Candidatus Dojkabacteria bacterium]|nr:aminoacyl-tRNA hydrolase [Candidatus Dojkabacteria bacterium]
MFVVAGLGNPGKKYEGTRHNAGYMFVDQLGEFLGWDKQYDVYDWKSDTGGQYMLREVKSGGMVRMVIIKPLTFMNLSGQAVRGVIDQTKAKISDELIVVHDDLDIPLGKFKIQKEVSPHLHNGVLNVEHVLGRKDFLRVRLGVDSREGDRSIPGDEYVLSTMSERERQTFDESVQDAIRQLRSVLEF